MVTDNKKETVLIVLFILLAPKSPTLLRRSGYAKAKKEDRALIICPVGKFSEVPDCSGS